jgi:hypothetical protein
VWSVWRRGRLGTVCARGACPAWSSGPSTSPLGGCYPQNACLVSEVVGASILAAGGRSSWDLWRWRVPDVLAPVCQTRPLYRNFCGWSPYPCRGSTLGSRSACPFRRGLGYVRHSVVPGRGHVSFCRRPRGRLFRHMSRLTIVGGIRERLVVMRRGRAKTVCARGA